jgi:hypothetical protein
LEPCSHNPRAFAASPPHVINPLGRTFLLGFTPQPSRPINAPRPPPTRPSYLSAVDRRKIPSFLRPCSHPPHQLRGTEQRPGPPTTELRVAQRPRTALPGMLPACAPRGAATPAERREAGMLRRAGRWLTPTPPTPHPRRPPQGWTLARPKSKSISGPQGLGWPHPQRAPPPRPGTHDPRPHSQAAGAGGAHERADRHVHVGGAALVAVETLAVVRQPRHVPQHLQVLLLLLPLRAGRHGRGSDRGGRQGREPAALPGPRAPFPRAALAAAASALADSGLGLRSAPPGRTRRGSCAARADRSHQPAGRDNRHRRRCHLPDFS